MKTFILYLSIIVYLSCFGRGMSLGAEETDPMQLPNFLHLDIPPFKVDFTSEGLILAAEGDNILRLYERDGTGLKKTWFLKDERLEYILGGEPSFALTDKNIYMIFSDMLKKYTPREPSRRIEVLSATPVTLPETWQSIFQSSERIRQRFRYAELKKYFNKRRVFKVNPDESPDDLLRYLKWGLGDDLPRIMKEIISIRTLDRWYPEQPLKTFNDELVTALSNQVEGIALYNTQKGSVTQYTLTHIPDIENPEMIMVPPKKRSLFVFNAHNYYPPPWRLFRCEIPANLSDKLVIEQLPLPSYHDIHNLRILHKPVEQTEKLFFLSSNALWQQKSGSEWEKRFESFNKNVYYIPTGVRTGVQNLLADEQGEGVMVAGIGLAPNLFHLSGDGAILLYDAFAHSGIYALLRDRSGKVWVGTDNGLAFMESGGQNLVPVQDTANLSITAIVEYNPDILFSDASYPEGGLFILENGQKPRKILDQSVNALGKFPANEGGENRIWIGGNNLFGYLDRELTGKTFDLLEQLRVTLEEELSSESEIPSPTSEGFTPGTPEAEAEIPLGKAEEPEELLNVHVVDMETVGDTLFVATNQGLVKFGFEAGELVGHKVSLPDWPDASTTANVQHAVLLGRSNGRLLVAYNFYDSNQQTEQRKLWQGTAESLSFSLIAEADFSIYTLAETAAGEILIGGNEPQVCVLRGNEIVEYRPRNYVPAPFRSLIVLGTDEFIFLAGEGDGPLYDLYHVHLKDDLTYPKIVKLDGQAKPWKQDVQLSDTQRLLLNRDGTVSLFRLGEAPIPIESAESFSKVSVLPQDGERKHVYLLGTQSIWEYDSDQRSLEKKIDFPPEIQMAEQPETEGALSPQKLDLAIDNAGLWLVARNSLWRYKFNPSPGSVPWIRFTELDGLPSSNIKAVVAYSSKEAVVFTEAGLCQAKKAKAGYWQFLLPKKVAGISGTEVRAASLFHLAGARTLALATDDGLSFVRWQGEEQAWQQYDQDSVLLDNDILTLEWNEAKKELWIASKEGVVVLELSEASDGSVDVRRSLILTAEQGLPTGRISEIRVSDDGLNAWLLSESMLTRLERDSEGQGQRIIHSDPFLLQNTVSAKLGPYIASQPPQPPQLLIRDNNLDWSVWNPAATIRTELMVKEFLFFWYTASIKLESLDPVLEDPVQWKVDYLVDRIDSEPLRSPRGLLKDLLRDSGQHYLIARIRSKSDPNIEYRATAPIPKAPSPIYRLLRLLILFGLLCMLVAFLFWYIQKRRKRVYRLRRREIPYIQGEAIQDASHFFGRSDLLTKLQATVPTTNYALVGEFRIGKTSIQFQLKDLLQSLENPRHTFLPIFIDLQLLRQPRETYFFHFLGTHLLELAQECDVPSEILDELHIRQFEEDEKYKSVHLKNDLEELFEFLEEKYSEKRPIILFQIDEITLMEDYDTLLKLRALLVREPRFKIVLSGRRIYKDPRRDTVSPWWNVFQEIEVEPLTPSEARKLIVDPVKGLFQFDDEATEHIIARSQGMPLAIQTMCTNVLHYKYSAEKFRTRITADDLYASLDFAQELENEEEEDEPTPVPSKEGNSLQKGNGSKES